MAAASVVCDASLLRRVTAFQAGVPLALYAFWVREDPQTAPPPVVAEHLDKLFAIVATKGTPRLLELFARIECRDRRGVLSINPVTRESVCIAIKMNNVDLVEWAITNMARDAYYDAAKVWWTRIAIKRYKPNDFAVLDRLQTLRPIYDDEFNRACMRVVSEKGDIHLIQWVHRARPALLAAQSAKLLEGAAARGNLEAVRYIYEQVSPDSNRLGAFERAYERQHLAILEYLLHQHPECIQEAEQFQRKVTGDNDPNVQAFVGKHVSHFRQGFRFAVENAVERDDLKQIHEWFESGWLTTIGPIPIDDIVKYPNALPAIQFFHENGLAVATTNAMDTAAEFRTLDTVDFLHSQRSEGCTVRAIDAAAHNGDFERIRFFHEHYGVECSAQGLVYAVKEQPIRVLYYLHEHTSSEFTVEAFKVAASMGRLNVVQFIHAKRPQMCAVATGVIDIAAMNGQIEVVKYLCEHHIGVATSSTITAAFRSGNLQIVRVLHCHFPDLFGSDMLGDLLLHGAFDIYLDLRETYRDEAASVVVKAMKAACMTMELATIHFILNTLDRKDLAACAAVRAASVRRFEWLRAVLTASGLDRHSVQPIQAYIAEQKQACVENWWSLVPALVAQYSSSEGQRDKTLLRRLRHEEKLPPLNPLLLDPRVRSWAVEIIVNGRANVDTHLRIRGPFSWAIHAVYMRDLPLLQALRELPASVVQAYLESTRAQRPSDWIDPFAFHGARAAAARIGDIEILAWLLENVDLPVEPTLLGEAVYRYQYDTAAWLVSNCPAACCVVDWTMHGTEPASWDYGLGDGLLDWLEANDCVRTAVAYEGIIDFAARTNDVASLRRLREWFPELFAERPSLVALGDRVECHDQFPTWRHRLIETVERFYEKVTLVEVIH